MTDKCDGSDDGFNMFEARIEGLKDLKRGGNWPCGIAGARIVQEKVLQAFELIIKQNDACFGD